MQPDPAVDVRQVRQADGDEGRQVRPVPRLQRLSRSATNTRELETAEAGRRRREHRGGLRELRQADGRQARPLRPVPRLHRLSRVQDDAEDHRDQAGDDGGQAGPDPRREVPEVRARTWSSSRAASASSPRARNYPELQVRQAEVHRRRSARRTAATSSSASRGAARCSTAARTIRTATSRCGTGRSPRPCPECGAPFLVEKITKRHGRQLICNNEECSYVRSEELRRLTTEPVQLLTADFKRRFWTLEFGRRNRHDSHHRRRPGRLRGRLAGRLARRARHAPRDAAGAADRGPQDRRLAELVCSNSFRGDKLDNAVGLLKEEMRRLGSLVMRAADDARVPAGAALAVDRELFSPTRHRGDRVASADHASRREEVTSIPPRRRRPGDHRDRSADVRRAVGRHRRAGRREHLVFLRRDQPDRARRDRSTGRRCSARRAGIGACGAIGVSDRLDDGRRDRRPQARPAAWTTAKGDYLNCPLTADEYAAVLRRADRAPSRRRVHDFDKAKFFEGCLPIEVMAHRGVDTLRFGPMKPVGLADPRTGREAVRRRAAAAGQSRRRSLQPGRLPDADEVGRAGARAAADSRASSRPSSSASA